MEGNNKIDVVRAWKDETYRNSLSEQQRALIPANPAGIVELSDMELEGIAGGKTDSNGATACCTVSQGDTACCVIEVEA